MRFDPEHLTALVAIAEEGTFDAAARRLSLTPSAVSQRIRALERVVGGVVVQRTTPATPTAAGEPLVRLGRQWRLLAREARAELGGDEQVVAELGVAVNADSLATWFRPVLAAVAQRPEVALRLHIEDQGYTDGLLRRGEVLAAVTDSPTPVQGCSVEPLGTLRYRPAAAPALIERHRHGRGVDWRTMPMVVFNERDHLQDDVLAARGLARPPVVHRVPSTEDFRAALVAGLGWGLLPLAHLDAGVAAGQLAPMPGSRPHDIALHWQRWRLESRALAALTEDVRAASRALRHR